MSGGEFDQGGRLRKGYRRRWQGSLRMVGNHSKSAKAEGELDCDTDGWSRYESRDLVIRWYESGIAIAQRIKATLG